MFHSSTDAVAQFLYKLEIHVPSILFATHFPEIQKGTTDVLIHLFRKQREKKKVRELRRKLQERMTVKNMLPGDQGNLEQDRTVFSLTNIKSKQVCTKMIIIINNYY